MTIEAQIKNSVAKALEECGIESEEILLEHPADMSYGDYSTNVALTLSGKVGKHPKELAEEIVRCIELNGDTHIEKVEVAGAGFINFYVSRDFFNTQVQEVLADKDKWGGNHNLSGKKIMVEYTQPNPFKPFHIGHLMSNTIGESISRLIEFSGGDIKRANYQGDIGLHVAKALWAINKEGYDARVIEDLGKAYAYGHEQYERDETAKAEIIELNKKIAGKEHDLVDTYEIGLKTSLEHFENLYKVLGTAFDYSFFESEALQKGISLVEKGLTEGVFEESEGAVVFKGEQYGLHTRVFKTKYGTTTYEARDLGLPLLKKEKFDFDESVTVTAVEQKTYFEVVFKAFSLLSPNFKGTLSHVAHGMMQLSSGKMSSREGNVVTGESLLRDMKEKALKKMEQVEVKDKERVAEAVSVSAIKYSILKQAMGKNISFDEEQSLSFEGDSGPYLQYTNARICSILEKASGEQRAITATPEKVSDVERLVCRFPEVVERAGGEYEPHFVTNYLIELAGAFNSWYGQEKILDDSDTVGYKLALAEAVSVTLQNGLWLLGVKTPEQM